MRDVLLGVSLAYIRNVCGCMFCVIEYQASGAECNNNNIRRENQCQMSRCVHSLKFY